MFHLLGQFSRTCFLLNTPRLRWPGWLGTIMGLLYLSFPLTLPSLSFNVCLFPLRSLQICVWFIAISVCDYVCAHVCTCTFSWLHLYRAGPSWDMKKVNLSLLFLLLYKCPIYPPSLLLLISWFLFFLAVKTHFEILTIECANTYRKVRIQQEGFFLQWKMVLSLGITVFNFIFLEGEYLEPCTCSPKLV